MPLSIKPIPDRMPRADTRILICEDDPLIALGWAAFLSDQGYTVVGPAHKAEKALEMAYQVLPTLALIDNYRKDTAQSPWYPEARGATFA
jgi:DNA-binding NarL/FixJ family response regulator